MQELSISNHFFQGRHMKKKLSWQKKAAIVAELRKRGFRFHGEAHKMPDIADVIRDLSPDNINEIKAEMSVEDFLESERRLREAQKQRDAANPEIPGSQLGQKWVRHWGATADELMRLENAGDKALQANAAELLQLVRPGAKHWARLPPCESQSLADDRFRKGFVEGALWEWRAKQARERRRAARATT
jgi:hypothetical protein